jgi:large conductance mechanosensitive channel
MAKMKIKKVKWIEEFKAFINRGSVVDMAVGVIIGGAFSAIVTAVVNILLSLCLCAIPGGFANLITPIYTTHAPTGYNDTYSVADFLAQSKTWTAAEIGMYVQHGTTYYYKAIPLLDWGALLTAVIDFFIIALILFLIVKMMAKVKAAQAEFQAKAQEDYYKAHPEERPAPVVPGAPAPTEMDVLVQIRDELRKQNAPEAEAKKE